MAPSSSLVWNVIICSALSVHWNIAWNGIFKKGRRKEGFLVLFCENTKGIGNASPIASGVFFFHLLLFRCFSFFSEARCLRPLASSNLSRQRCLLLSGLGPPHPPACRFCEQSLCQEFLKHRESFVRKWEICWFLQFLSPDYQRQNPQFFQTVEPIRSWSSKWARRGCPGAIMLSWPGAKSCGSQVGKDSALDHGTERASKSLLSGGNPVQGRYAHIHALNTTWAKLLIFIAYHLKKKKKKAISAPFFFSWANTNFWSLDLVLIFQVCSLLVAHYPMKRKEESSLISWEQTGA